MASIFQKEVNKQTQKKSGKEYHYGRLVLTNNILDDAGFKPGDDVKIICENGKIIIKNETTS